jgi:hypothetical protein
VQIALQPGGALERLDELRIVQESTAVYDGRDLRAAVRRRRRVLEVIARDPMLHSRIYRRVAFAALTDGDILELIPSYHRIYHDVDPDLLLFINDQATHGRMRSWAAFTMTAASICDHHNARCVDREIARPSTSEPMRPTSIHACRSSVE